MGRDGQSRVAAKARLPQAGGALWGSGRLWLILAALLVAVLVPTAFVLWFMVAAMRNERLAVRQRLAEVYQGRLSEARRRLGAVWEDKARRAGNLPDQPAPKAFAIAAHDALAQAVIVRDAQGGVAYPAWPGAARNETAVREDWEMLRLEQTNPAQAQELYAQASADGLTPDVRAAARMGQARCLLGMNQPAEAIGLLREVSEKYPLARDANGRLVGAYAGLLAWQLAGGGLGDQADALVRRADDYSPPAMPPAQRRLLMRAMWESAGPNRPATFDAEVLADAYLAKPRPPPGPTPSYCGDSLWHVAWGQGRLIGVFRQAALAEALVKAADLGALAPGATLRLVPPGDSRDPQAVASLPAGDHLPNWTLEAVLAGADLFESAADRRRIVYLWAGAVAIAAIVVVGISVAAVLGRQLRLAQLKNSLVAAVTHELKTPLSSIRVLIDLLLEGQCRDPRQVREYHQLIARENQRLGRLIDNFLTHSRIEQNKPVVRLQPVDVGAIVASAVEAMADRFDLPNCRLQVDVPPDLPRVLGDADALTTVLVNLLDNAWKYTPAPKEIALRARADGRFVHLAVADNGMGIHRRDRRKIFKRFYRVEQSLSASASGCGLGLSIAKFVVDAHGGSLAVDSEVGRGSTFTVSLAQVPPDRGSSEEAKAHVR